MEECRQGRQEQNAKKQKCRARGGRYLSKLCFGAFGIPVGRFIEGLFRRQRGVGIQPPCMRTSPFLHLSNKSVCCLLKVVGRRFLFVVFKNTDASRDLFTVVYRKVRGLCINTLVCGSKIKLSPLSLWLGVHETERSIQKKKKKEKKEEKRTETVVKSRTQACVCLARKKKKSLCQHSALLVFFSHTNWCLVHFSLLGENLFCGVLLW